MLVLITGANSSGKSLFAEQLISRTRGERCYIATMIPRTEDNRRRIEKHRVQRCGLGFTTLELPYEVGNAPVGPKSAVLLEDVSNLLANGFFERGRSWEDVFQDILALEARCGLLVAVTISGLDPADYDGETADYAAALRLLNGALVQAASHGVRMRDGMPELEKGDWNGLA